MEEVNDDANISTEQEEANLNIASEEQNDSESVEEYKTRLSKAEELANNYKIRAEKAEKLAKQKQGEPSKQVTPAIDDGTLARIYDLHEDDLQEVKDMAKFKNLSIAEALKLGATKAILAEKAELRKSAEIANTGSARRGVAKVSPDTLKDNLSKGIIPDKGSNDAEELFWARRGGRR